MDEVSNICDLMEMSPELASDTEVTKEFDCPSLFMCGNSQVAATTSISFHTANLFIGDNTIIDMNKPAKASNGGGCTNTTVDGQHGSNGINGSNFSLNIDTNGGTMKLSKKTFTVFTRGGDGGDGGNGCTGKNGANGESGRNGAPGKQGYTGFYYLQS